MKLFYKLFIVGFLVSGTAQADDKLTQQVHQKFIDDYIVAHLKNFKDKAVELETSIDRYCFGAARPVLEAVKLDFAAAVQAWMPLQSMRFGTFEQKNRDLRVYFWPNSRGEKQAGKMLRQMDSSKHEPNYFPNISVALQGLPIIEWLLYHPDSTLFADDMALRQYSCHHLSAISQNILEINHELIAQFGQYGAMRKSLLELSVDNKNYTSLPEVTLQLYKNIHAMVDLVHGQKLSRPIAKEYKFLKPKRLEMWRSGQSKVNLHINIASIFEAYEIFSPLVKANNAETDQDVRQQFETTLALVDALPDDFYAALNGDARAQTWQQGRELIAQMLILKTTLADNVTSALDIPLGFNSLDGD